MKHFFQKNRLSFIIGLVTVAILIGGIFLFTKDGDSSVSPQVVSNSLLVPQNAIITSGFSNGTYLPASASASLTLVEFGDYECPACGVYSPFIKQLLIDFPGEINYVFRNYPLPQHKNAPISSYAVEAAGLQGKYWEMQERVYETQGVWSGLADPTGLFMGYAKDLNLDLNRFTSDIGSDTVKDKVDNDKKDGDLVGITETPTFYLNGKKIILAGSYDQLKKLVESALSEK
ncbi:MAG: Dsba oxidoreductase [Microgenomates group bacterium GW2011_GWC1_43_13]|uniref:DSBA oxidoreductase n=2 Tax=Candidatus Woeseibacteriota TaxID=1752722 RepID=A0A837ICX1_9BACT|nr:MAG: Dsba oxidoreductase [Microgenomates group bacterium GW2011_GWC1_43_13]KKT53832.1 MAG: DSBA oxidoreductase [Candidatus Woesebacteria bacterium GW2011_GWA1_44_23]OGM76494.1 MAG: hypothetical protein A2208_02720 [Candidatus Woesebacteria bacterium RIFOXYA1_FULL_43_16]OGM85098.1 MAG: hypothetical protein A2421_01940 [Candidatus Woesebacteria bacterium RIFOXYC1_FULL_43_18]OGM88481.1 MAG: hypothetical protein A2573_01425 [Candidatus Woesebacteria bacterium RIFOXYD1_FULL_43_18]